MRINKKYLTGFLILLIIEIFIALFVKDTIIRQLLGDVLVVIVIYAFIKTFVQKSIKFLPVYLFLFAATVEIAQFFKLVEVLHLQNNRVMATIIGATFDIKDILCYLMGMIVLILWEKVSKYKL